MTSHVVINVWTLLLTGISLVRVLTFLLTSILLVRELTFVLTGIFQIRVLMFLLTGISLDSMWDVLADWHLAGHCVNFLAD